MHLADLRHSQSMHLAGLRHAQSMHLAGLRHAQSMHLAGKKEVLEMQEIASKQACSYVFVQEHYIKAHVFLYFLRLLPAYSYPLPLDRGCIYVLLSLLQELMDSLRGRVQKYRNLQESIANRARLYFTHFLMQRDYNGKLKFSHEKERLEIQVCPVVKHYCCYTQQALQRCNVFGHSVRLSVCLFSLYLLL